MADPGGGGGGGGGGGAPGARAPPIPDDSLNIHDVFCVPRAIITARNSAAASYSADTCTDRGGSRGGGGGHRGDCPPPPPLQFNNPTIFT